MWTNHDSPWRLLLKIHVHCMAGFLLAVTVAAELVGGVKTLEAYSQSGYGGCKITFAPAGDVQIAAVASPFLEMVDVEMLQFIE